MLIRQTKIPFLFVELSFLPLRLAPALSAMAATAQRTRPKTELGVKGAQLVSENFLRASLSQICYLRVRLSASRKALHVGLHAGAGVGPGVGPHARSTPAPRSTARLVPTRWSHLSSLSPTHLTPLSRTPPPTPPTPLRLPPLSPFRLPSPRASLTRRHSRTRSGGT